MAGNSTTPTWMLHVACAAVAALGCSSATNETPTTGDGTGAVGGPGASSPMTTAPAPTDGIGAGNPQPDAVPPPSGGVTPPAGGGEVVFVDDEAPSAVPVSDETACAGTEVAPEEVQVEIEREIQIEHEELKPLALYVVLDNSQSMRDSPSQQGGGGGGGTMTGAADSKWNQAVEALTTFISDDASAGIGMAIQYFHPLGVGDDPDECDGSGHGTPAVPMDVLPNNADALVASLGQAAPTGYTPTVGALTGGVQYCDGYQQANPDTTCVVVLVTDGQPRGCGLCDAGGGDCYDENSISMLSPLAAAGNDAGVKTFTVGMDGITAEGFELLDAIAAAGGTDCTPDVEGAETCDVSQTGAQGFADALSAIRDSVITIETIIETEIVTETTTLACQWGIPEPPDGEQFRPELVNVTLATEGGEPTSIGGVVSETGCADSGGFGWYYDNPSAPQQIIACPATCTEIETATDPVVQVLLGCQTVPPSR